MTVSKSAEAKASVPIVIPTDVRTGPPALVARNRDGLVAIAHKITDATHRSVEVIAADLNNASDLTRIETKLRTDASVTLLVNNAGVGATTPLLASDVDKMEAMIGLNVTALTRLACAAVPGFVARGRGAIINIASIVALAPDLLNGVYGATKAFVLAFSQSLQHELADKNVRVQVVLPGCRSSICPSRLSCRGKILSMRH
jgi:uncharacterized protein